MTRYGNVHMIKRSKRKQKTSSVASSNMSHLASVFVFFKIWAVDQNIFVAVVVAVLLWHANLKLTCERWAIWWQVTLHRKRQCGGHLPAPALLLPLADLFKICCCVTPFVFFFSFSGRSKESFCLRSMFAPIGSISNTVLWLTRALSLIVEHI